MFNIRYITENDIGFWLTLDKHLSDSDVRQKIRDKQGYVISDDDKPMGVMRYNLFWDNTPFLNLISIEETYRGKGYGKKGMAHWENEMRSFGYKFVMTSTQSDEQGQFFYRKIGYSECGCLILDNEPLEILLKKNINT